MEEKRNDILQWVFNFELENKHLVAVKRYLNLFKFNYRFCYFAYSSVKHFRPV